MSPGLSLLVAVAAGGWSLACFGLYRLLAAGSPAVFAVTRWLEIEPDSTQWLADGLAEAAPLAAGIAITVWLVGAAGIALAAWLVGRNPR
jgi:hypothetical protein